MRARPNPPEKLQQEKGKKEKEKSPVLVMTDGSTGRFTRSNQITDRDCRTYGELNARPPTGFSFPVLSSIVIHCPL